MRKAQLVTVVLVAMLLGTSATSSAQARPNVRPLGTVTPVSGTVPGCPVGSACRKVSVACPGVSQPALAAIAVRQATAPVRGMAVFFSGSLGDLWWSIKGSGVRAFFAGLQAHGMEVVEVEWLSEGWLESPTGERDGQIALACRPASVVAWIHQNLYLPLGVIRPPVGVCGFCLTGNSAGGAQVAYSLAAYGLAPVVDALIPTSGPPLAAMALGCLMVPHYEYETSNRQLMDDGYGFNLGGGPCVARDPKWKATWDANSVETGGDSYRYPTTRVDVIVGGLDFTSAPNHARAYYDVLASAGQPNLTWQVVPVMGHPIQESAAGLAALDTSIRRGQR